MLFVIFQASEIDCTKYKQSEEYLLNERTFSTNQFYIENSENIKPAGLAFFQSDWDESLTDFFHHKLNMKEPRFEYDFAPYYTSPWSEMMPRHT